MAKPPMSLEQRSANFWRRVKKMDGDGCWIWLGATNGPGYGKVYDGQKIEMAHRFSYRISVGAIPDGMFLCHKCDNPICVRPDHLFIGTASDNNRDCYKKGRSWISKHNAAGIGRPVKLNPDKVREIRARIAKGESQQSIANHMGVNQTLISSIVRGKTWKHVK